MKKGYYSDYTGFSGAFTWFRSEVHIGMWLVTGFCEFSRDGYAVTDDFGTLVEVNK